MIDPSPGQDQRVGSKNTSASFDKVLRIQGLRRLRISQCGYVQYVALFLPFSCIAADQSCEDTLSLLRIRRDRGCQHSDRILEKELLEVGTHDLLIPKQAALAFSLITEQILLR